MGIGECMDQITIKDFVGFYRIKCANQKIKGAPGFRSLHGFNFVLLGKHVWQFLNNSGSLVARIFKARYYPTNYIL